VSITARYLTTARYGILKSKKSEGNNSGGDRAVERMNREKNMNREDSKPAGKRSVVAELAESILVAVVLALVIRLFILEPFYIPSGSMIPTLEVGDRIIVCKFCYKYGLDDPSRGDVIVFRYPVDPSRNFVKRIIAVGGETVAVRNSRLYINGEAVPEPYLPVGFKFGDFGPLYVPPGSYFVMGDNRNYSEDSRKWGFLDRDLIIGKAVAIYWPLDRLGVVK